VETFEPPTRIRRANQGFIDVFLPFLGYEELQGGGVFEAEVDIRIQKGLFFRLDETTNGIFGHQVILKQQGSDVFRIEGTSKSSETAGDSSTNFCAARNSSNPGIRDLSLASSRVSLLDMRIRAQ
jgi:hypothetical protein